MFVVDFFTALKNLQQATAKHEKVSSRPLPDIPPTPSATNSSLAAVAATSSPDPVQRAMTDAEDNTSAEQPKHTTPPPQLENPREELAQEERELLGNIKTIEAVQLQPIVYWKMHSKINWIVIVQKHTFISWTVLFQKDGLLFTWEVAPPSRHHLQACLGSMPTLNSVYGHVRKLTGQQKVIAEVEIESNQTLRSHFEDDEIAIFTVRRKDEQNEEDY
jgi:hypothetical protein